MEGGRTNASAQLAASFLFRPLPPFTEYPHTAEMTTETIDLLDDSDEDLALPLAARLAAAKRGGIGAPPSSQERAPLAALYNQADGGAAAAAAAASPHVAVGRPHSPALQPQAPAAAPLGGAETLRQRQAERAARKAARAAAAVAAGGNDGASLLSPPSLSAGLEPPRPQYHQQEQRQDGGLYGSGLSSSPKQVARGSMRGAGSGRQPQPPQQQRLSWEPAFSQPGASQEPLSQQQTDAGDEDWQPPSGSQGPQRRGGRAAAGGGGGGEPPAKKARKPRRTQEEIARDKALQVAVLCAVISHGHRLLAGAQAVGCAC